jgi:hypothetical protein
MLILSEHRTKVKAKLADRHKVDFLEQLRRRPTEHLLASSKQMLQCNLGSHQQFLNLLSGGLLHVRQDVRVDIECECHGGVPELFAHDLRRDASD